MTRHYHVSRVLQSARLNLICKFVHTKVFLNKQNPQIGRRVGAVDRSGTSQARVRFPGLSAWVLVPGTPGSSYGASSGAQ